MPGTDLARRPSNPPAVIGQPQPQRESEAGLMRPLRWAKRNRHLSVPLAVPPLVWTAGEILHAGGWTAETGIAAGVTCAAMAYFAPHKWTDSAGKPRKPEIAYALASAAGAGTWLSLTAAFGASSGLSGEILGGTLVAGSVAWGIPWWRHKRPRGLRRRQRMLAQWEAWWQGHCAAWGLQGSRVIDATETGVTIRLRIQLWAGRQSVQDVKQAVRLIESGLEGLVAIGRVRVEPLKNPSQVELFFKRENPLAAIVKWDPALAPRSVHDQAVDGMSETGQWQTVPMRVNKFVNGRTRSGKSNDLLLSVAQLSGCPDSRQVLIDLKGGRSARPALEAAAVDGVITEVDEARMYLLMLTQEIRARGMYWYDGHEQLLATADRPAIHTLIDEVHGLTSLQNGDTECSNHLATGASEGSGLEVYYEVYTQCGDLENSVRTEQTRSNLRCRKCFAVEEARHGAFTIPDYDQFDASKLEEQGTHLLKIGPKAHTEQIRSPHMPHELLKRITAANARALAPRPRWVLACGEWPCPAGGTWQEWWDARWLRLHPAFRKISPQYAEAAARTGYPPAAAQSADGVIIDPSRQAVRIAPAPSVFGEGDGASVAARLAAETDGPDIPPPDRRTRQRLTTVLQTQKEAFCDALACASSGISPAQLEAESGMSSSWIYPRLARLSELGAITRPGKGVYVPVPGADIHAALARVDGESEALLKDAQKAVRHLSAVGDR